MKNEKQADLNASMADLFQEAMQHGVFPGAGRRSFT